ncbi:type VII secretion integral membrane protein EccD [Gordonia sp. CPCC 205515]|uniref:type VII secretion integral membrane protein EccD n=1 Tax=Gordonia sp. CPCC 205515 TaxID=3140791 RepID=UPI003AF3FE90
MSIVDTRMTPAETGLSAPPRPRSDTSLEPHLVRVSVLGGNTQLDVGLPAASPIAAVMPDLVAQIQSRTPPRRDPDDADPAEPTRYPRAQRWTLGLVGQEQISPNRSLAEAGIRDGDLLILRAVCTDEAPPLFDDVVDAVARLNESRFPNWSPRAARTVGQVVAVVAAGAAAVGLGATRTAGAGAWVAGLGALAVIGLLTAATITARHVRDDATATVLCGATLPLALVTGMLLVPKGFGAAHLTLGCALTLVTVTISYRLTAAGPVTHSAASTAALLGGLGAGAATLFGAAAPSVAAVLAAVGVLVITLAPRATIVLAKLPLPPVPTAGTTFGPEDTDPLPAIDGIGAISAIALPKAEALQRRSFLSNSYLTGIVGGAAVLTAACAVGAAPLTESSPIALAYGAVVCAVLCLRGRSHSDRAQAIVLIGSGSLGILALITGLAVGSAGWPLATFGLGIVMVAAALVFGVLAPTVEFSPVMRRAAEIGEYLLIAVIVPLLVWLLDLYRMVREI